jgi:P pilus assembly chaperone PapD
MLKQFVRVLLLGTGMLLAVQVSSRTVWAMSVEPVVLDVASFGGESKESFRVVNNGASTLPVEINVSRMELGPDGDPSYQSAEDDFLIYPPQANIPKGGAQTFRVQWIGDPDITASRNYRISVSQVPVKLPSGSAGIQILMSFGVAVGVSPPQSKAAISVTSATPTKGKDGESLVALQVNNSGNRHAYLGNALVSLSGRDWSVKLSPSEVVQKVGVGIVQAGKERRFLIPVEVPAGVSDITASIDYQPGK